MVIQSPHSLNFTVLLCSSGCLLPMCEALLQTCLHVRPFIVEDGEIHRVANVTCPSQPITPQDTFFHPSQL